MLGSKIDSLKDKVVKRLKRFTSVTKALEEANFGQKKRTNSVKKITKPAPATMIHRKSQP